MASTLSSCMFSYRVICGGIRGSDPASSSLNHQQMNSIKIINGNPLTSSAAAALSSVAPAAKPTYDEDQYRQNIPTKKQLVDPFRHGLIIEGGVGYRQTVVVRSYEVGPDKTATLETILNLLQETALNHVWMSGLLGDGFGATHGMARNNLIWVVTRMLLLVDSYPIWGEIVEIDTWVAASGKNGMRRDWLIRSHLSGQVFARGTSTWVMMNKNTRRLSKMPEEVRQEIAPWFIDRQAIPEESSEKIEKLDDMAKYVNCNLKPKRSDLDMNHHVNNVKYVKWMLESIPDSYLESHQLSSITLEYRRECGSSDMVQSLCQPDEETAKEKGNESELLRTYSVGPEILNGNGNGSGLMSSLQKWPLKYTHLLQTKGENKNEEIVRGRTTWKKKPSLRPFSNL
ncbi:hypothetical protein H6P81_008982 [Aristolochia fimbriata]|uniref:Acyl-[acyl-carrier-protein] hydrolase n=1 Tax=Aristolochia fimbriata TaxID=158543 RepID=A0AAV7EJJ1_ARIFI|nr:hypothetical protein H6P81_008982 [Aristolochia fimbriata]